MDYDAVLREAATDAHRLVIQERAEYGNIECIRTTTDADWIALHGTDTLDLATCPYRDLPADWKAERDIGAKIAVDALVAAQAAGRQYDEALIVEVAETLHKAWLERNSTRAGEEQKKPYAELSEYEQAKDRAFVLTAHWALEADKDGTLDESGLRDLERVGPHKPVGYMPLKFLELRGHSISELQKMFEAKGLKTCVLPPTDSGTYSGALYVYDEQALSKHLEHSKAILAEAGWPTDVESFIRDVDSVIAPTKTALFDVVADAFADTKNQGRTNV